MIWIVLIILAVIGFALKKSDLDRKEKLLVVFGVAGVLLVIAWSGGHI
ncbi:hypothetical protein [Candidatus Pelagibacter sp. HIMB1746]|jgi:asparagine N-glycosylation enzyme membrane subunit Stt3